MVWICLIGAFAIFLLAFVLEYLFYSTTKKERQEQSVTKTHAPIKRTITSLVMTIVLCAACIAGAIVCILSKQQRGLGFWLGYTLGCLVCIAIPLFLLLLCIRDYEIITDDFIVVHRLTGRKEVKYSDISHFKYSLNQLTVYDKTNAVVFFVADGRIGLNSLIQSLEKHGVQQIYDGL